MPEAMLRSISRTEKIVPEIITPTSPLTPFELDVFALVSLGSRLEKPDDLAMLSELLSAAAERVTEAAESGQNKFGVPNVAAAIYQAIHSRQLPFERQKRQAYLTRRQVQTLGFMAYGYSNAEIARVFDKNDGTFVSNVTRPMFRAARVNSRERLVRFAFEQGYFELS